MRKLFRRWYKSKTQWLNGSLVFMGLVQSNIEEFRQFVNPSYFGGILIAVGMIGWYLRTVTTQPIEEK